MVRVVTSTIFDTSLCRYFRHFTGDPFSISAFSICISSPFQEYHQQIISNLPITLISESPTWAYSSLRFVVELPCGIHNSINYHYLRPMINQLNAINHPKESPPVLLQHLECKRTLQAASHLKAGAASTAWHLGPNDAGHGGAVSVVSWPHGMAVEVMAVCMYWGTDTGTSLKSNIWSFEYEAKLGTLNT